jgi:hypothetical protein
MEWKNSCEEDVAVDCSENCIRSENRIKSKVACAESKMAYTAIDLSKVEMGVFATEEFVAKQLSTNGETLVSFINEQSPEFMENFVVQYDKLPDAMCGKLFACGVNPSVFPRDIQLSAAFIRVAAGINPTRLVTMVLNHLDIQSVRLALKNFPNEFIENLWKHGMPVSKIPLAKASNDIFKSLAVFDWKRFSMETKAQINSNIRHFTDLALPGRATVTVSRRME